MDSVKIMDALRRIDEQHRKKLVPDKLHPLSRLIVSMVFIITVLSCPKYAVSMLIPFMLYPALTIFFDGIPTSMLLKRLAVCLPPVILLGVFNPVLDKNQAAVGGLIISAGWFSFAALFIKCTLTVTAALLLVCAVGIDGITASLHALRVPKLIVAQLSFTYRYIYVLGDEVVTTLSAYSLRAPGRYRNIGIKNFGSIAGGLFLRASRHAGAVYSSMRCRGFNGVMPVFINKKFSLYDVLYIITWISFFVLTRYYNLSIILGDLLINIR